MKGWNGKVTQGSDELKAGGSREAQSTAFIRSPVGLTSKQLIRLPDRPHCYTHFFYFLYFGFCSSPGTTVCHWSYLYAFNMRISKGPLGSWRVVGDAGRRKSRQIFFLSLDLYPLLLQLRTGFLAQPLPSVVCFLSTVLDLWANVQESVQCLLHPSLLFSMPSEEHRQEPRTLETASLIEAGGQQASVEDLKPVPFRMCVAFFSLSAVFIVGSINTNRGSSASI